MKPSPLLALPLVLAGCAPRFAMPMTASDLVAHGTGAALVAYLSQPDAGPTVCDPDGAGPHLRHLDAEGAADLVDGLGDGRIRPEVFRRCAERLLRARDPAVAAHLLTRMGEAYRDLLKSADLGRDPALAPRLAALHALYLERPSGADPEPARMAAWTAELTRAAAENRLGPAALPYARELVATIAIEHGQWNGAPVTAATLDALLAQGDEALLRRFAARLPDAERRQQALRRVVRLHIAASTFPEVREHAHEVEDALMAHGRYALSPDAHPPVSAQVDAAHLAIDSVLVRQAVPAGTAKILGARGSVVPEVPLRGAVRIALGGVSRPVTLCGPAAALDPTPCVDAAAIALGNRLTRLDRDGDLLFADNVPLVELLPLARSGDFTVPLALGGRALLSLRFGVRFETPADLGFDDGEDLHVDVDARGERVLYAIAGGGRSYVAVVERAALSAFHVITQGAGGAPGYAGSRGMDGSSGMPGMSASCPSSAGTNGGRGGDGTSGGSGGPGGPGGPGGDVTVSVDCGGGPCDALVAALYRQILSVGGPGGPGGPGGEGGRGGSGGSGGSGTSCTSYTDGVTSTTSVSGGSQGANGSEGMRGSSGSPGPEGRAGEVRFRVVGGR
jgi:hypothetical protein